MAYTMSREGWPRGNPTLEQSALTFPVVISTPQLSLYSLAWLIQPGMKITLAAHCWKKTWSCTKRIQRVSGRVSPRNKPLLQSWTKWMTQTGLAYITHHPPLAELVALDRFSGGNY